DRRPDRLPLGAAQARRAEAHLPRACRGGRGAASVRPRPRPLRRLARRHPLRRRGAPLRSRRPAGDPPLRLDLALPPDRLPGGRGRRGHRGRPRHAQDHPHPFARPHADLRRQGDGQRYLRRAGPGPDGARGRGGGDPRLWVRAPAQPVRGAGAGAPGARAHGARARRLPDAAARGGRDRPAPLDRDPQLGRGGGGHAHGVADHAAARDLLEPRADTALPADHAVLGLAGAGARTHGLGAGGAGGLGLRPLRPAGPGRRPRGLPTPGRRGRV
ncbi:MAG: hypothetical protein AVDCRST_MAG45-998, partial [uncultured Solirubrobacterales bacterium]